MCESCSKNQYRSLLTKTKSELDDSAHLHSVISSFPEEFDSDGSNTNQYGWISPAGQLEIT